MLPMLFHSYYKNRKKAMKHILKNIFLKEKRKEIWYHPKVKFHSLVGMNVNKAGLKYFDARDLLHHYSFSAYQ